MVAAAVCMCVSAVVVVLYMACPYDDEGDEMGLGAIYRGGCYMICCMVPFIGAVVLCIVMIVQASPALPQATSVAMVAEAAGLLVLVLVVSTIAAIWNRLCRGFEDASKVERHDRRMAVERPLTMLVVSTCCFIAGAALLCVGLWEGAALPALSPLAIFGIVVLSLSGVVPWLPRMALELCEQIRNLQARQTSLVDTSQDVQIFLGPTGVNKQPVYVASRAPAGGGGKGEQRFTEMKEEAVGSGKGGEHNPMVGGGGEFNAHNSVEISGHV